MTRNINCIECGSRKIKKYPGEGHKKVFGLLRFSCLCDDCGKNLQDNAKAVAVSLFKDNDYFPWEDEYVDEKAYLEVLTIEAILKIDSEK